ncbi:MAG: CIA30 family protein [Microcystaceae cyanobacterium]
MANQPREKWDFRRFWDTLNYFDILPFWGCIKNLLGFQPKSQTLPTKKTMKTILVIGATGGVGKRVVSRLLDKNYAVRALVRDAKRGKEMLGDKVELFEGDVTIAQTLTPKLMENVTAVISGLGVKVQPVEGDTPQREKYYQGIKFYMPEVVDSPEKVEYEGNKNVINIVQKYLKADEEILFDFTNPNADIKSLWGVVDDVVMGGVSESQILLGNGKAVFSGNVSIANNGGFASVRTKNITPPLDLSDYKGISLRVKGDGKRYKFIIRCEGKWDGVGYCYSFDTFNNIWQTIDIPFDKLIPVFRAKTVPEMGDFDTSKVYSMQLMHSKFEYNGDLNPRFSPGLFTLELESIKAYGGKTITPQFIMVGSAGVTRPGRPNLNLDEEPPAVRLNEQLGGILTWKLRGEEVVRNSDLTYTVIRPCALTEKPDEYALEFDQGDNIKGQVSRDAIADLCVQCLALPEAINKTFEVRQTDEKASGNNYKSLLSDLVSDQ